MTQAKFSPEGSFTLIGGNLPNAHSASHGGSPFNQRWIVAASVENARTLYPSEEKLSKGGRWHSAFLTP